MTNTPKKTRAKNSNLDSVVTVDNIVELGQLLLRFSRIERVTSHEDGLRLETDADHTVMLSVLSCAIADKLQPDLDLGKIAQYALIHDLVETYAGDTPTIRISEAEKLAKKKREAAALIRINHEFGDSFPWLIKTMESYEALDSAEARFVKGLDKLMPIITHILNNGTYIRQIGMTKKELVARYDQQIIEMSEYSYDTPEIMKLRDAMAQVFIEIMFPDDTKKS
jgi:5'-deoxynucleotidase YfbR-like HD superfamily hydrolase